MEINEHTYLRYYHYVESLFSTEPYVSYLFCEYLSRCKLIGDRPKRIDDYLRRLQSLIDVSILFDIVNTYFLKLAESAETVKHISSQNAAPLYLLCVDISLVCGNSNKMTKEMTQMCQNVIVSPQLINESHFNNKFSINTWKRNDSAPQIESSPSPSSDLTECLPPPTSGLLSTNRLDRSEKKPQNPILKEEQRKK